MTSTADRPYTDPRTPESPQNDATSKPRVHRRGAFEYVAWLACALVTLLVVRSLVTNENYQWSVVAQYFTAESVIRGPRPDPAAHLPRHDLPRRLRVGTRGRSRRPTR